MVENNSDEDEDEDEGSARRVLACELRQDALPKPPP